MAKKQKAVVQCKQECDWVGGTNLRTHEIPDYDAEADGHCKFVQKPLGVPRISPDILRRAAVGGGANPFKGQQASEAPAMVSSVDR